MDSKLFAELIGKEIDNYLVHRYYAGKKFTYTEMKDIALFTAGKVMELVKKDMLDNKQ